ncbi:T9SS type B sorting domain-containing protein [Fulvitalea axinellae]|uniref:T9SS type B sorting domain-containing protein n=1 Tax=Fulvitalea axinellae TaxID=1182444 RepID=UPI0030CA523C
MKPKSFFFQTVALAVLVLLSAFTISYAKEAKPGRNGLSVSIQVQTPVSCSGGTDGVLRVNVTGGIAPYTYLWSNGAEGQSVSGLSAGEYSVTVKDVNDQEAVASVVLGVSDTEKPVVLVKDITLVLDASGKANLTPDDVDIGTTDNCGIKSLTLSQTLFSCVFEGENTVTLTAEDFSGNKETATFTVTVKDEELPMVVTKDISVKLNEDGNAVIRSRDVHVSSLDVCGIEGMNVVPSVFDCNDVGPNVVTLKVRDNSGNVTEAKATVTVLDFISPEIICPADITAGISPLEETVFVEVPVPEVTDNCGENLVLENSFNETEVASGLYPAGEAEVRWTVKDSGGNSATCTMIIKVDEKQVAPVIEPIPELVVNEGEKLDHRIFAHDPNGGPVVLELSDEARNAGLDLTPEKHLLWTPTEQQGPAIYEFDLKAKDLNHPDLVSQTKIVIRVNELNTPHTVDPVADVLTSEHEQVSFNLGVTDSDLPAQKFTFALAPQSTYTDVTVDPNSGIVQWSPGEEYGGVTHKLDFVVVDDSSPALSVPISVNVTVREVNDPVKVETVSPQAQVMSVGDAIPALRFRVSDPEGLDVSTQVLVISSPAGVIDDNDFLLDKNGSSYDLNLNFTNKEFVGLVSVKVKVLEMSVSEKNQDVLERGGEIDYDLNIEKKELPLDIPNIFTPNGDGVNDTWNILNLSLYAGNTVRVFDQFGRIVYKKTDYSRDDEWGGKGPSGEVLEGGYFYQIELVGGKTYKGSLTVIR